MQNIGTKDFGDDEEMHSVMNVLNVIIFRKRNK